MNGRVPGPPSPPLGPEAAAELTRAILARTSGSPCQRLEALACAFVDGELDAPRASAVRAHLEHCPACSALVAALRVATEALATFSGADPGPWFSQRVLVATVRGAGRGVPDGFDRRGLWSRLLHRPRICLEAAYLGAAAGLMGLYLPLPVVPWPEGRPALVQPLETTTRRVAGELALAGQRTGVALKAALPPRAAVLRLAGRGRSWLARGRAGLSRARAVLGSAAVREKTAAAPNS